MQNFALKEQNKFKIVEGAVNGKVRSTSSVASLASSPMKPSFWSDRNVKNPKKSKLKKYPSEIDVTCVEPSPKDCQTISLWFHQKDG